LGGSRVTLLRRREFPTVTDQVRRQWRKASGCCGASMRTGRARFCSPGLVGGLRDGPERGSARPLTTCSWRRSARACSCRTARAAKKMWRDTASLYTFSFSFHRKFSPSTFYTASRALAVAVILILPPPARLAKSGEMVLNLFLHHGSALPVLFESASLGEYAVHVQCGRCPGFAPPQRILLSKEY